MKIKKSRNNQKKDQDILFKWPYIWIITLSITTLNFLITYNLERITSKYIYYFLVDILTTYLIIEFYALGIRFLNKKTPINQDFVKRVTHQLTLHTLSVISFSIVLNELFDHVFFGGTKLSLSFEFYTTDTIVALIFVLFFHTIYFTLFFMTNQKNLEALQLVPEVKIKVTDAFATKLLSPKEIILIYSLYGTTYVINRDFNKFTSQVTLKEFEKLLPDEFFRANRKSIISKEIIDSYKSSIHGKIDVALKLKNITDFSKKITISRDKAGSFRSWLS